MKKKLVFSAYVFGTYTKYIPFYVYGLKHSYPEHSIKIFINKKLSEAEWRGVSFVNHNDCEIKENFLNDVQFDNNYIRGGNQKILRWLIPHQEFKEYEYAYIGDVDMFVVKENPTLLDSHVKHMIEIKMPFSNGIRRNQNRLTGLHFIDVEKYYGIMNETINGYLIDNKKLNNDLRKCPKGNEEFLYNMVKNTMGFGTRERDYTEGGSLYYRPHHGLHIGLLRVNNPSRIEVIPYYVKDDELGELLKIVKLPELENFVRKLK